MKRIQLIRLIDEMSAVLEPAQLAEIALSMDVSLVELNQAIEEISEEFDRAKDAIALVQIGGM